MSVGIRLRRIGRGVLRTLPVLFRDAIGLAGAASLVYGVSLIHRPAGFIAAGGMALAAALVSARRTS